MSNIDECEPLQLTSKERTRELDRQLYADHLAEEHAERRERIATAALQGLLSRPAQQFEDEVAVDARVGTEGGQEFLAGMAVDMADALIAALDAKETP